jgi:hypothetical protein
VSLNKQYIGKGEHARIGLEDNVKMDNPPDIAKGEKMWFTANPELVHLLTKPLVFGLLSKYGGHNLNRYAVCSHLGLCK